MAPHDEQDVSEWDPVELAYTIAFHRYYYWFEDALTLPASDGQMLNKYLIYIGTRLFEKYGWVAGEPDCSTILPLDEWAPGDRQTLIELYKA